MALSEILRVQRFLFKALNFCFTRTKKRKFIMCQRDKSRAGSGRAGGRARYLTLAILCAISAVVPPADGSSKAFTKASVTKLCKLTTFLKSVPGDGIARTQRHLAAENEARAAAALASLAVAAAQNRSAAQVYGALATAATKCADKHAADAKTTTEAAIKASALAGQFRGKIQELVNLLNVVSEGTDGTGLCLVGTGGSAAISAGDIEIKCHTDELVIEAAAANYNGEHFDDKGFKNLTGGDMLDSGSHTAKCHLIHNTGTSGTGVVFQQSGTAKQLGGGTVTITLGNAGAATAVLATANKLGTAYKSTQSSEAAKVFNALGELQKQEVECCGTTRTDVIRIAGNSGAVKKELEAIIKASKDKPEGKSEAEHAETLIKEITGEAAKQGDELLNTLQASKATKLEASALAEKELKHITDSTDLSRAAGYATAVLIDEAATNYVSR
uniref:Variant surface glycoprotein 1125.2610 n=1 Tax=Trypanosoma brucei TaxID=5691 RepID=A0A1J0R8M8_9TRYP|nr:variant surface glycoprotein 1125.2610 [Trypanosoma brucei]